MVASGRVELAGHLRHHAEAEEDEEEDECGAGWLVAGLRLVSREPQARRPPPRVAHARGLLSRREEEGQACRLSCIAGTQRAGFWPSLQR